MTSTFVVLNPKERPRFDQIVHDLTSLKLPHRAGNDWLQVHLNKVSHRFPRPYMWLLLGPIVLPFRQPRGIRTLVVLTFADAVSVLIDALGQGPEARDLLPAVPAFILFGTCDFFPTHGDPRYARPWRRRRARTPSCTRTRRRDALCRPSPSALLPDARGAVQRTNCTYRTYRTAPLGETRTAPGV
jgi:hypothetical protein